MKIQIHHKDMPKIPNWKLFFEIKGKSIIFKWGGYQLGKGYGIDVFGSDGYLRKSENNDLIIVLIVFTSICITYYKRKIQTINNPISSKGYYNSLQKWINFQQKLFILNYIKL